MFVAERFIAELIKTHDKHSVSTAVALGIHRPVKFLKLQHHIHSAYEKSVIERTI